MTQAEETTVPQRFDPSLRKKRPGDPGHGAVLLVLGAGSLQVPGIKKALAMGHTVITLDNRPANPGHQLAHASFNISTTDVDEVVRAARECSPNGITTFSSDVAVPSVAAATATLGLPGVPPDVASLTSDKIQFRRFLRKAGLPHPDFRAGEDLEDVVQQASRLPPPLIVKPADSSGSRGVAVVHGPEKCGLRQAVTNAFRFSRRGAVCVETFVPGIEVGGDAILKDGRVAFMAVTHKHMDGFLVRGHSLPTNVGSKGERAVRAAVESCCRELGYANGPLNFDVKVTESGEAVILEVSARTGGNGIPRVIERTTGVDVEAWVIRWALGMPAPISVVSPTWAAGVLVIGSHESGRVVRTPCPSTVLDLIPEVFEAVIDVGIGDEVEAMIHNGNQIGRVLFDVPEKTNYDQIAARIDEIMSNQLEVS